MRSLIPATLLVAVLAAGAGCTAAVVSDPYPPDLVYVSPGVQVIADYNEPIFYSDGLYWRYSGGNWYRSHYYSGGWAYARPPAAVLRIDRPYGYVRYRPSGWAARPRGTYATASDAGPGWLAWSAAGAGASGGADAASARLPADTARVLLACGARSARGAGSPGGRPGAAIRRRRLALITAWSAAMTPVG